MNDLNKEIETYDKMREELETKYMGKWVLIHDQKLEGVYDSFETTSEDAVKRFGSGPYLIRQVGAPAVTLSASVIYRVDHA